MLEATRLDAARLDAARLELVADVPTKLLNTDERVDVVAVDDRILELIPIACDERLDDTVLADVELARLDEATTNDD
jgi:predicted methyltransferase